LAETVTLFFQPFLKTEWLFRNEQNSHLVILQEKTTNVKKGAEKISEICPQKSNITALKSPLDNLDD